MKEINISLNKALKEILVEDYTKPIIAHHELTKLMFILYRDKQYKDYLINKVSLPEPEQRVISYNITKLLNMGVITKYDHLPVYQINSNKKATAQQIICSALPFSYLSYLSAMEWHGITDRISNTLQVVTCIPREAKSLAEIAIKKDLPNIQYISPLIPQKITLFPALDGKIVEIHKQAKFSLPKEMFNTGGIRVANVGKTFLDMLKKPDLCGGFDHVIEVFENYGEEYLAVIIKEINNNGNSMDKARAGYLLEERCGIKHKKIEAWKDLVQRGGSRKLVPSKPYRNIYSETWCISLND